MMCHRVIVLLVLSTECTVQYIVLEEKRSRIQKDPAKAQRGARGPRLCFRHHHQS